ncbi:two component LuxR family transcriptional regulator [Pseudomonas saudimassiliensis]|uniref:Two component LuxR family transcriptional regulator n=1 Tax=Pseudomonas saudimassiliensis TaxID=1461581 RepID=A0A078MJ15_9PSED|nr:response regulator transcription factor [Pseudomonas saudimassiliensis]CEA06250.1 two component LuxR family transcriptional regulator [Pseudomonas saudimassiliensis]CEF27675.1 two component LuxR family transcriptional regulator [Pseudomonas saudimassiliensis]
MPIATLPPDTRLLLIDDHQIYLDGLTLTLNTLCKGIVLDHARNAAEAEQQVRQHTYDLILLDLHLPDSNGLILLEKLRAIDPLTPVAMLTGSTNPSDMDAALRLGAAGFISKTADGQMLVSAALRLLFGEQVVMASEHQPLDRQTTAREQGITPRQLEILDLLAEGLPNKVICQRLSLSEDTVKTHLKAVFSALGCHNRTECVNAARRHGLISS